jgi:hypothetical protein
MRRGVERSQELPVQEVLCSALIHRRCGGGSESAGPRDGVGIRAWLTAGLHRFFHFRSLVVPAGLGVRF